MSKNGITQALALVILSTVGLASAQAQSVVGTWTRVSLRDSAGKTAQPPQPPDFVIFSANGYFSQLGIPAGRKKVDKAPTAMTKEELVAQFDNVDAWRGTYAVAGTRLTRKTVADIDPLAEGNVLVQVMRFAGDTLILTRVNAAVNKSEARFVRVR